MGHEINLVSHPVLRWERREKEEEEVEERKKK